MPKVATASGIDDINTIEPGFWTQTGWRQLRYAICSSTVELSIGMAYGFAAVMHPQIVKSKILAITVNEGAWLVSIIYLFLPVGNMINGAIMDRWGRRAAMIVGSIPLTAGWVYTGLSSSITGIIVGRAITGFGCGMATGPPRVYIAELSLPNARPVLCTISPLTTSLGITLLACLGTLLTWQVVCIFGACYTFGVFVVCLFLPESPSYLMKKSRPVEQIRNALKKFRGDNYNLDAELRTMEEFKNTASYKKLSFCKEIAALCDMSVCHPFMIFASYLLTAQMTGVAIMVQWTVTILNASMMSVDSKATNIVLSTLRCFTLILMAYMMFYVRRRQLSIIASIFVGVSCLMIFFHLKYSTQSSVYPFLLYLSYTFFSTLGFYCMPFIIMTEIYPLQVRGLLGGLSLAYTNILSFVFTKVYPEVESTVGLHGLFLIFAISAFVGAVGLFLFLPETKGLSLQEIEEYFRKIRPSLISTREVLSAQQLHVTANSQRK